MIEAIAPVAKLRRWHNLPHRRSRGNTEQLTWPHLSCLQETDNCQENSCHLTEIPGIIDIIPAQHCFSLPLSLCSTICCYEISRMPVIDFESQWISNVYLTSSEMKQMWQQAKPQSNKNDWHIKRSSVLLTENNKNKTQNHKHKVPLLPPPAYLQNPSCWLNSKALLRRHTARGGKSPAFIACNPLLPRTQANVHNPGGPTLQEGLQALAVWGRGEGSLGTHLAALTLQVWGGVSWGKEPQ